MSKDKKGKPGRPKGRKMVKAEFWLYPEELEILKAMARRRKRSFSAFVRDRVEEYVAIGECGKKK